MAQVKINSVVGRTVAVTVVWANGWQRNFTIPDCPVESFTETKAKLDEFISAVYANVEAEEAKLAYANPTPDPMVLAAVGHTFDDAGNVVA